MEFGGHLLLLEENIFLVINFSPCLITSMAKASKPVL